MDGIHNQPHFGNNPAAVYSRIVYAAKSTDVQDVLCNGRFLMRDKQLLTVDEAAAKAEAAQVAAEIDAFVLKRESSPYNKLVFLAGVQRQQSFEVQVKVPLAEDTAVLEFLHSDKCRIIREAHYKQYDNYFIFEGDDPDAARLRYREDEFVNEKGEVYQTRSRLTLIGEENRQEFSNAVMLSRSRFLADASRSLRFYREYFDPALDVIVNKDRQRWHILYKDTDFAVNLDQVTRPRLDGYFLEIKSRTWSRTDAERKADLMAEILALLNVDLASAERREYLNIVLDRR
jgi:5-methylthioadenosine/S-adenosylhomocysteine deaminase